MKIHYLKTEEEFYLDSRAGRKNFEVRKNDRDYRVGDIVILQEYIPARDVLTGRQIERQIKYVLDDARYCKAGFVVLGF